MSNFSKILGICGAVILIVFDIWNIISCFGLKGADLFNAIINNALPCGLVLGTLALCAILNKTAKKQLSICSLVVFSFAAVIRVLAIILYILERAIATYLPEMIAINYVEVAEYVGYALLSISVVFLSVYILKAKLKKTTQILGGISIITLIIVWITYVYFAVTDGLTAELDGLMIFKEIFAAGLIWDVLVIAGYTFVLGALTDAMEKKEA